jgi:hypothetical protein
MTNSQQVTAADLVIRLNLNRKTLDSWILRGHLDSAIILRKGEGKNKKNRFDFEKAKLEIERLQALAPIKSYKSKKKELQEEEITESKTNTPSINQIKIMKLGYDARLSELDYKERLKELVNAKDVIKVLYSAGRAIRESLLAIPGRVASEIAQINDDKRVEKILTQEIIQTLEEIQDIDVTKT